jgi:hypothetical protein
MYFFFIFKLFFSFNNIIKLYIFYSIKVLLELISFIKRFKVIKSTFYSIFKAFSNFLIIFKFYKYFIYLIINSNSFFNYFFKVINNYFYI